MLIQLKVEGGIAFFPGLSQPVLVDTTSLPVQQAAELEQLVRAAHFFARPIQIGATAGKADHHTYTLTVQEGSRTHSINVVDPVQDASLQALIAALQAHRTAPS